jgi:peptidoglycan hydrolase CwlO-like protein
MSLSSLIESYEKLQKELTQQQSTLNEQKKEFETLKAQETEEMQNQKIKEEKALEEKMKQFEQKQQEAEAALATKEKALEEEWKWVQDTNGVSWEKSKSSQRTPVADPSTYRDIMELNVGGSKFVQLRKSKFIFTGLPQS